jgi:glycyl-tRNA synthetase
VRIQKIIDNQTLGYFLARVHLFLLRIAIDPARLRFRQHMPNEMAHYAADCWDAEIQSSYGWIECVGCADRSAYDLTVHSKATGTDLVARVRLDEPIVTEKEVPVFDKKNFGKTFQKDNELVKNAVLALNEEGLLKLKKDLSGNG